MQGGHIDSPTLLAQAVAGYGECRNSIFSMCLLCMYAVVLFVIHTQQFLRSFERDSARVIARTPQLHT